MDDCPGARRRTHESQNREREDPQEKKQGEVVTPTRSVIARHEWSAMQGKVQKLSSFPRVHPATLDAGSGRRTPTGEATADGRGVEQKHAPL